MKKWDILSSIVSGGLVAVVRADNGEQATRIAAACLEGGLSAIEITYTVPGATEIIEALGRAYGSSIILGAGTVLDPETARLAILAGAQYVVGPSFSAETARLCNRYQVPYVPGIMTIKEAQEALEHGADILKVFPGEVFGPGIIKSIKGPLPQANLMPTGGVSLENVEQWISAGAVAVGVGGQLTAGAKSGDYAAVATYARNMLEKIRVARKSRKPH
ncbi:MAG: bifunctional 2-keto-4-hydroxyglutarate aldolase/2-keto-3-deoxy-6-phosphogluconate aldolase [Thermaerobacter sp.]|nr:bifunctional 2-keto-4-hydroxyglutarate aldolase/2-keto-3-deoxy-6-phosphogluconate aldolase [Thermaerobacter sp.]